MKKKNKKLDILMILTIIAGVLVLGAAGTLIGLEAGRLHTEVESARAEREARYARNQAKQKKKVKGKGKKK